MFVTESYLRAANSLKNNDKDFIFYCKFNSVDLDCCYCMLDQPLLLVKEIKVHESVCENPFLDICILSSIYNIGLKYE